MSRRGPIIQLASVLGFLLCTGQLAAQQSYTITGRVVAAGSGTAIQGAQVSLRGTSGGGLTNNTGLYSFQVNTAPGQYNVEVAFIGRETVTQAVELGTETTVRVPDIELRERALELDAVIVTGTAAPTARRALGNAVSTVSSRELAATPATTIDQALQGRVSGAVITANTGTPGGGVSVRLRGTSSITGGAEPLYIIDGVIIDNNSDQQLNLGYRSNSSNRLADLDPNDIERIEILKGAAAAALYGSRANNGVVQIFTRRGRTGDPEITVSSRFGRSDLEKRIDFALTPVDIDGNTVQRFDPQDVIFRDGSQMEHHVSLSGGGGDTRYYLSGGFTDEEGIMIGAGHEKLNVRMNVDQGLGNFQLSAGANYIRSNTDLVINGEQGEGGLLTGVIFTSTTTDLTARNPETGELLNTAFVFANPLEVVDLWDIGQSVNRFIGSLQGRWAPINTVNFEYRLGYDNYQMETSQFIPRGTGTAPIGRAVSLNRFSTLLNNDLLGSVQWGAGDNIALTTSGGMNHTYLWAQNLNATATDLGPVTELVRGANMTATQGRVETATLGFFGQQQIAFADRIFLTGALRMDASSTFGADERWQMYPKVSGSWVLSEEPFMEGVRGDWLTQLRLRGALGYAGNQPPLGSAYSRFSRYGTTINVDRIGLVPLGQSGNPELKPERQREYELGFDLSTFNDRAALAFTYYNQYTKDLLLSRPFAPSTGVGSVLDNVGELSNKGVELQLNTVNVDRGPFRWTSTLIYSRNKNVLEKLEGDPFTVGYTNRVQEGHPIGAHYMRGFQRDESGAIMYDVDGLPINTGAANPVFVGNPWPEWTGSLANEFGFGPNWSASFLLDGQFGHDLWNRTRNIQDIFNAGPLYDQLLRGEITAAERTRLQGIWEYYIEDASFVKLRQLALRYSTSASWLSSIGASAMQLEILGRNLVTWTDYTGYDPEVNMFGLNTVERGVDFAVYPNARTYTIGVRLTY
ncbi:MAG TPA: TonB-dependent receptor [Longimicrobiales bacterium]|nr:TonB-dependent receptor [Longimicrobiales bacterium]